MTDHRKTADTKLNQISGKPRQTAHEAEDLAIEAFREFAQAATDLCTSVNSLIDPAALYQSLAELAVSSYDDNEARIRLLFRRLMQWLQVEHSILLWPDNLGEINPQADYSTSDPTNPIVITHTIEAIARRVIQTGRTVCVQNPNAGAGVFTGGITAEPGDEFVCCVPVRTTDNGTGALYLCWLSATGNQSRLYARLAETAATWLGVVLQHVEATQARSGQGDLYRATIDKFPAGVIIIDDHGNLIAVNTAILEIFDVNRNDIWLQTDSETPSRLWDLLGEKEQARWQYMITTALTSYQTFVEPRYFHNTGYMEKVLSLKMVPLHRALAGQTCLMITIEDITERSIMDKYIILSEKHAARGEMADKIAHRLNNLLAVLNDRVKKLAPMGSPSDDNNTPERHRDALDSLAAMKAYIDSLTDLVRPDTEYITYDFKGMIEDILFSLKHQARFRPIHFTLDINHDLPDVEIDVSQMQHLITILLENSADATEERAIEEKADDNLYDREIGIKLDHDPKSEKVILDIRDNGRGISGDIAGTMFTKAVDIKKGHGTESLACARIVKQHNGEITVQSEPGYGTTIRITLPLSQPRAGRSSTPKK